MLSQPSLDAASALAHLWTHHGAYATPLENSPLVTLQRSASNEFNAHTAQTLDALPQGLEGAEARFNEYRQELRAQTEGVLNNELSTSMHTEQMDQTIERVTQAVRKHVQTARQVVAPVVSDFVERLNAGLMSITPSSLLQMQVRVLDLPLFMTSTEFVARLAKYRDVRPSDTAGSPGLPAVDQDTLLTLLKTGVASLDEQIQAWVKAKGVERVEDVWCALFLARRLRTEGQCTHSYSDLLMDPEHGLFYATVIYLLAAQLYNEPIQGTDRALDQYNEAIALLRDQAAADLFRKTQLHVEAVKANRLVASFVGKTCLVYESSYVKFLAQGGNNEMLLGNILSNDRQYYAEKIVAQGAELERAWERTSAMIKMDELAQRHVTIRRLSKEIFALQLREEAASASGQAIEQGTQLELRHAFNVAIDACLTREFDDLNALALKLICQVRFANSGAQYILTEMERIARESPKLDARDAATLAVLKYVAQWVGSLIKVGRIN